MEQIQYISILFLALACSHIGCQSTADPRLHKDNVVLFSVHDGVLQAWLNRQRFLDLSSNGVGTIKWRRQSCFDPAAPDTGCPLDVQLLSMNVEHEESTDLLMPGFTYNSDFHLEIMVDEGNQEYAIYFTTPHCSNPDATFTVCRSTTTEGVQTTTELPRHTEAITIENWHLTVGLCSIVALMTVVVLMSLIYQHVSMSKLFRKSKAAAQDFTRRTTDTESMLTNIRLSERSRSCNDLPLTVNESLDVTTRCSSLPGLDRLRSSSVMVGGALVKPAIFITVE